MGRLRDAEVSNLILDDIRSMYIKAMKKLKIDSIFIPISHQLLNENQDKPLTIAQVFLLNKFI